MTIQDYTIEELKSELKRMHDLAKAEKAKVKRCIMCKHWGGITCCGDTNNKAVFGINRCCKFFKTKSGKYYKVHSPYHLACEHFEEKQKTL